MSKATDVLFVSHGGGPMPLLGDPGHQDMVDRLTELAADLRKPSAILVISAHWEEAIPTITSGTTPSLIYDYYGFPSEAYKIEYPCPGEPVLAQQVAQALDQAGIQARLADWEQAPHARFCHPREEHLLPLHVCYGLANKASDRHIAATILGKQSGMFYWG